MKKTKNNKGVTLLALVVTIIIILLLGTILLTTINNGKLISNTKEAVLTTELKNTEEALKLAYQRDETGSISFERTRASMENVVGSFNGYSIRDNNNDFPITIFVPAKYDNKVYRYIANRNGTVSSDILDEMVETGVSDIYVAWDEEYDMGEPTGRLNPTIIIKAASITQNYSESDAVKALNFFFEMQYDAYNAIKHINDNYIKVKGDQLESWIESLTSDESSRSNIKEFMGFIQMLDMKIPNESAEPGSPESEGKSILEMVEEEHLVASANNEAYTFGSLDDALTFINAHKMGYFKVGKVISTMANAESSDLSEEEWNQIYDFIEDTLSKNNISSIDGIIRAAKSIDFTQFGAPSEFNAGIASASNKVEEKRIRKGMSMGLIFGEAMTKATIGEELEFLSVIDKTIEDYVTKYTEMAKEIKSDPFDALMAAGEKNIAEFMGKTLTYNGLEVEINDSIFKNSSGYPKNEMYIYAALGIIPIRIENAFVDKNSTEEIKISFDNYSNSKTISEWDVLK